MTAPRYRFRVGHVIRHMYDFEQPQALVEIDLAVGLDVAGRCGGPLLVAVESVIAIAHRSLGMADFVSIDEVS